MKSLKYHHLAPKISKKPSQATFLHFESCPENTQSGHPYLVGRLGAPKTLPGRSQGAPIGTPKDHPEPPDEPLGPPWNVKSLPRTYQVPSRALLTSPKGTPDAKKRAEEHQVCECPTPGTTTTTQYTHQVRKVRGCVAPLLDKRTGDDITPSGCSSCLFLPVPACSLFSPYSSNTPVPLDTAVTRSVLNK